MCVLPFITSIEEFLWWQEVLLDWNHRSPGNGDSQMLNRLNADRGDNLVTRFVDDPMSQHPLADENVERAVCPSNLIIWAWLVWLPVLHSRECSPAAFGGACNQQAGYLYFSKSAFLITLGLVHILCILYTPLCAYICAQHGQVVYPWKEHKKSSSEMLNSGPKDTPIKSNGQKSILGISPWALKIVCWVSFMGL